MKSRTNLRTFHAHLRCAELRFCAMGLVFLLTDIRDKRHHRTVVGFDQPAHDHGRIKTS